MKEQFLRDWASGDWTMSELCRRNGISRPTGYALVQRYEAEGEAGLAERSRAPVHHPHAIAEQVKEQVLALRRLHPTWGPKKLRAVLETSAAKPATSSIGELLKREGLVISRRVRRQTTPSGQPLAHADGPNVVWSADFKGWFRCGDGQRCDPLTISDAYSRYLLRCRGVEKTDGPHVRAIFEAAFREYGLPWRIRTDNGPPFASCAPAGLSRLSMWWLRLGITPERIAKGHPEQNGRHERMHRTMQQELASPPRATYALQQRAFLAFEQEFNQVRPHEALAQQTPASLYRCSLRTYPAREPELVYPEGCTLRRIHWRGHFFWKHEPVFVSEVLQREFVGLCPIAEDLYEVYYGMVLLGWFAAAEFRFVAVSSPAGRRNK